MSFSHLWRFYYGESLASEKQDTSNTLTNESSIYSEPRPVVVIFGWLGSQMRHLQRFVQLYHQRNCDVILLIPPTISVWVTSKAVTIAEFLLLKLSKFLATQSKPDDIRPVLFHLFSGAPKTVFYQIMKIFYRCEKDRIPKGKEARYKVMQSIKKHIIGIIYDSCPIEYDSRLGVKNLSAGQGTIVRYFWEGTRVFLEFFFGRIWQIHKVDFWATMDKKYIDVPHLFFYSTTDDQAPYETIERYIQHLKSSQVEVHEKKWDDSKHVQHYLKYRDEYTHETDIFFNRCYNMFITNQNANKKISSAAVDVPLRSKL